jgi:hypothetical protein
MTVREILAGTKRFIVTGGGYEPTGQIEFENQPINLPAEPALSECLKAGLLCNDAELVREAGRLVALSWSELALGRLSDVRNGFASIRKQCLPSKMSTKPTLPQRRCVDPPKGPSSDRNYFSVSRTRRNEFATRSVRAAISTPVTAGLSAAQCRESSARKCSASDRNASFRAKRSLTVDVECIPDPFSILLTWPRRELGPSTVSLMRRQPRRPQMRKQQLTPSE